MASNDPPANVSELLIKVRQSVANIARHRDAMAEVAATIRPPVQQQPVKGVTTQ